MESPLIPQKIFLSERYISAEYFSGLRATWDEMIAHLDRCLDEFMRDPPSGYSRRALPEQPHGQQAIYTKRPCNWRLVRRTEDIGMPRDFTLLARVTTAVPKHHEDTL